KGRFRSVEELQEVSGFGDKTVEKVRPYVRVEPVSGSPREPAELEPAARKPVPSSPAPRSAPAAVRKIQPGDPPINVNTASAAELQRLPDVGPVVAKAIIDARSATPFRSVEDLDRVKGIGPKRLDKIRPFVVVK
ncbi:MAG TPA: helix-hairpin-helix domain-containing protein, partial [Gemmataceae bacterium]|nr:helix-hairpin-helix domain-containing protein [Gemmataceae bacterium]